MKNCLLIVTFLFALQISAQSDVKKKFQKNRYDLAVSYFKKLDYVKAIDLFSLASKIDKQSPIGLESREKVDTLKTVLRKALVDKLVGTWKKTGNEPSWTANEKSKVKNNVNDELIVISNTKILFYEENFTTKERKLLKSEDLVFYDKDDWSSLISEIILSDKTIWNYLPDDADDTLRVVNMGTETDDGINKVVRDSPEIYYVRVK